MHIRDLLAASSSTPTLSFELFPPNTSEGLDRLQDTVQQLATVQPAFFSVTYGAGGSTREATQRVVRDLKVKEGHDAVPHLTCVRQQKEDIDAILEDYAAMGVSNILTLRGDPPRHIPHHDHAQDVFPRCIELVKHIRKFNERSIHPDKRGFGIGVAGFPEGHPATPNRIVEMDHLKAKVDAGADYICTQLFFDNYDFLDFRERCILAGIKVPILAGIMPVTSLASLRRMAELAGGARVPARLLKPLMRAEKDAAGVRQIGLHHAAEQCADLLHHGVAGIHLYTLNQAEPSLEILKRIAFPVNDRTAPTENSTDTGRAPLRPDHTVLLSGRGC